MIFQGSLQPLTLCDFVCVGCSEVFFQPSSVSMVCDLFNFVFMSGTIEALAQVGSVYPSFLKSWEK